MHRYIELRGGGLLCWLFLRLERVISQLLTVYISILEMRASQILHPSFGMKMHASHLDLYFILQRVSASSRDSLAIQKMYSGAKCKDLSHPQLWGLNTDFIGSAFTFPF